MLYWGRFWLDKDLTGSGDKYTGSIAGLAGPAASYALSFALHVRPDGNFDSVAS